MNQLLSNSAFILLFATAVFQTVYVLLYRKQMKIPKSAAGASEFSPKTAVILCLRGVDPGLEQCLSGIANLEYDDFELHIVMDHDTDSSQQVVRKFFARHRKKTPLVRLHTLDGIDRLGSLKCQSIVHVIDILSSDTEVVALIDADAIVNTHWLTTLVHPLANSSIGATTGTRWFTPPNDFLGSWVREIWNTAAVVQMQLYKIAWGGSLAIKMSVFDETDLLLRWRTAFCEDTMLASELEQHQFTVHRVPNVIVDNRESTSMVSAVDWIARQLLTVRLYHPHWFWVFAHAVAVGLCVVAVPLLVVWLALTGAFTMSLAVLIAWLLYQLCNGLLLKAIRVRNRKILAGHDTPDGKPNSIGLRNYVWALLVAQMVQPVAACKALIAQTVRWRGVEYRIENDSSVSVIKYRPYCEVPGQTDESIQ